MDPLGVTDVCALRTARFNFVKPLLVSNLSSLVYPTGNHIFFFGQNVMYIYSLQTNFDRPRVQMMTALSLVPQEPSGKIDSLYCDAASQLVTVRQGTKALFYQLNGSTLDLKLIIDDPIVAAVDFQDKRLHYFGNKNVVYFDRISSEVQLFTVNENQTLVILNNLQNCQEVIIEPQYALVFTNEKIKALDGKQELGADFPYKVLSIARSPSSGIYVYAQDFKEDSQEEATLFSVEYFEKKGFRLTPVLTGPRYAKAIHITSNNLFVVYDSWVRVYPTVREKEFSHEYYFDTIMTKRIFGVLVSANRNFLVVQGKDQDIQLHEASRSGFALECQKEKGVSIVEYSFQVRCFSTKCDNPDFSTQKFSNGSCAYTRTLRIYPEEEGGSMGVALLVTLGFVAGIAITIGLGVLHCFATKNTDNSNRGPRSPSERRSFNINRGLRRSTTGGNQESKKFLNEVDESYTSEEFRGVVHNAIKKKPQALFETPRFVSGGGLGNHMYVNIDSKDQTSNEIGEFIGSGVQDDEGSGEIPDTEKEMNPAEREKIKGKVEMANLKLGEGKVLGKDLVSFRDVAMQNVIHEEKEHKEGGKYQEFQDEDDDEEANLSVNNGHGEGGDHAEHGEEVVKEEEEESSP